MLNLCSIGKNCCVFVFQKEIEEWRRPRNFNKALGEAQHLIDYADMNKVFNTLIKFSMFVKCTVLKDETR